MRLIDGHLDLAMNALNGRDLTWPLEQLRLTDPVPGQTATTTFAELQAAGTAVCFATLFALPASAQDPHGYRNAAEAKAQALAQLEQYLRWQDAGHLRLLTSAQEVKLHLKRPEAPLGVVLLMEGADPVLTPSELPEWVGRGVKIIGPAWTRTRYAGGTDTPGPLSAEGRELVQGMKELGVTLDASHLDDAAFWDALDIGPKLIATHSNSRALTPGNRHLSDEMAQAVAQAGGVIGLVLLSRFIRADWQPGTRATLSDLLRHAEHYAALVGWEHLGIGSDLDGGFGAEQTPVGIGRYRDLPRLLELLPPERRLAVALGNWERWLTTHF
ncbi:membrane dipeptidase [Deinococcus sp.]|uniref:dipeptidase n=1 Tax=Deinococcus sp. TaxID=47478 RepID=UPI0025C366D1|nr:membrane dipeptidase [Deinococcus sp.]